MKNKKIIYFIGILIVIGLTTFLSCIVIKKITNKQLEDYLFVIENKGYKCPSNAVYFYSDKTYIVKGMNNKIINKGKYEYNPDLLINELKTNGEDIDNETFMNYEIKLHNGDTYIIRHDNKIISEFLKNLKIAWC